MAFVSRKISFSQLLRNWGIVFVGNLLGSLIVVILILLSGQLTAGRSAVGVKALMIANDKVNLTFMEAFSRGVLCNILVCLAVYLCFSGRSVTDKILAILFPITAFVPDQQSAASHNWEYCWWHPIHWHCPLVPVPDAIGY
jgi:formate/nitrite transporter FocA (FNT family)